MYRLFTKGVLVPRNIGGTTVINGDELRTFLGGLPVADVRVKKQEAAEQAGTMSAAAEGAGRLRQVIEAAAGISANGAPALGTMTVLSRRLERHVARGL